MRCVCGMDRSSAHAMAAAVSVSAISSPSQSGFVLRRGASAARVSVRTRILQLQLLTSSSSRGFQLVNPKCSRGFDLFPAKRLGFSFGGRKLGFGCARAEKGEGNGVDEAEETRGESTMPERFRYLSKEVPDPPLRWPWLIVLAFLIYAWRTVLWELYNWKKAALAVAHFVGYLLKLVLALVFHFIGDPITSLVRCIETALYTARSFYSSIVAYAPVPELTLIIVLTSAVIAIAEATVPESASGQPYLLTLAGIIGFAAVKSFISEPLFFFLLFTLFGIGRFIKKRDYVSSVLPVAVLLAGIGEPWIRATVMALYTALAIAQHSSKKLEGSNEVGDVAGSVRRLPVPLLAMALAIGIRVAAKWAGYRHLTWMIA